LPDGGLHTFNQNHNRTIGRGVADWETEIGRLIQGAREFDESAKKFMLKHNA